MSSGEVGIRLLSAALVLTVAGIAAAHAQPVGTASAAQSALASFAVQKLVAVDGTMLSLQPVKGGLSRDIILPGGALKKTVFTLLNGRLGTVSGAGGSGVFVVNQATISPASILSVYADGRTEVLGLDAAHTVSITVRGANGDIACASWYPLGHAFSLEQRKAALAQYARHIGLHSRSVSANNDCAVEKFEPARQAAQEPSPIAVPSSQAINVRGNVLNGIMTRIFAPYPQKEPAVPPRDGLGRPDSQSWNAFDRFYSTFLAPHEGGYTENDGNGSPANYGINQGANPDIDVVSLTQTRAEEILYERYWLASGADQLPQALGAVHGDTAVNLGVRTANEILSQSGGDPDAYLDLREVKYRAIAAANPDKETYLPVWLGRNEDLRSLVSGGNQMVSTFVPNDRGY